MYLNFVRKGSFLTACIDTGHSLPGAVIASRDFSIGRSIHIVTLKHRISSDEMFNIEEQISMILHPMPIKIN